MNKEEIIKIFYKEKNYSKIKEILIENQNSWSFNILGKIALQEKKIEKAQEYFELSCNFLGLAYCYFYKNEIKKAQEMSFIIKNQSSASCWLNSICNLLLSKKEEPPSYMQIRNFFEQDLEMAFFYENKNLIEKLLENSPNLQIINGEVNKFCGRVLLHNNEDFMAEIYLKRSLNTFYQDPETHFLLGETYEKQGFIQEAIASYNRVIGINKSYYPAIVKINLLTN